MEGTDTAGLPNLSVAQQDFKTMDEQLDNSTCMRAVPNMHEVNTQQMQCLSAMQHVD